MAIFNGLRFGNVNSLDYGIYITGEAVYNAPERDVEMVEIAGRNGDLPVDKGRWKNIEVTYTAGTFGDDQTDFSTKVRNFRNALTSQLGYVRLSDTYNDNEYRLGVFKSVFEVDAVSRKRAGEFQIVFDCKPQRFLMSGEASQDITSGQDLYNSTGYDAQPLLMVEGYGTVNVGNYDIDIQNVLMGEYELDNGIVLMNDRPYNLPSAGYNSGDTFTFGECRAHLFIRAAEGVAIRSVDSTDSNARIFMRQNGVEVQHTFEPFEVNSGQTQDYTFSSTVPVTIVVYASGTTTTYTVSYTVTLKYKTLGNEISVTASISNSPSTQEFYMSLNSYSFDISSVSVNSTMSALGHPTYVDCEIGEAYKIENGEFVSLNRYIDLGSKVPVLKGGSNIITFDSTVTSLKVAPKWWIL